MNGKRTPQITLFGNLGADPETHTLNGRTVSQEVYDIVTDQVVVREHTTAERQIRTVSLAVNGKDGNGDEILRWHRLVDFANYLTDCRKGDRLKVTGYFRDRTYFKNGEERSIRELVLTAAEIQPKKDKAQAA
jgi:single-stranded DNA-binding protein